MTYSTPGFGIAAESARRFAGSHQARASRPRTA